MTMNAVREAVYLLVSTIAPTTQIQHQKGRSSTPQSVCCQVEQFFQRPYRVVYTVHFTDNKGRRDASSPVSSSTSTASSANVSTTPLDAPEFPLFNQLPVELQRSIWRLAASSIESRIIPIAPDDAYEDFNRGRCRCIARIRSPALLSTCSDARAAALRIYELKFHAQLRNPIYFNSERDTLLMCRTSSMYSFLQSTYEFERRTHDEYDRDIVENLALLVNDSDVNYLGEDSLHGYPSWRAVSMASIAFQNLRELRLVYRRENADYTTDFQREKITLGMFWSRHCSNWQQLRARALLVTRNLVLTPTITKPPNFVYWSREELEHCLPDMERWVPENLNRRSRGSPEPLYGRNQISFFEGLS